MKITTIIFVLLLVLSGLLPLSCAKATLDVNDREEGLLTEIPFRLYDSVILMELSIDESSPLLFIFDTGAGGTVINEHTAMQLGIVGDETVSRIGGTGTAEVKLSNKHTLDIGRLTIQDVTLGIVDLEHIEERLGIRFDGVIGWKILSQYAVSVDYDVMRIGIYDNKKFKYNFGNNAYPIEIQGTTIFTDITVALNSGSTFNGNVVVDTGSGGTISFNTPFIEENSLLSEIDSYYTRETKSLSTESSKIYTTMIANLNIGEHTFSPVPADLAISESGAFSWSGPIGILGNEILKRFNMFINLEQNMISLEPNQLYNEEFEVNCSGLELGMDDTFKNVIIDDVYDNSPAEDAGLRKGDVITKIEGIDVSTLQLRQIRDMLTQTEKEIEIVIDRNDESLEYTFILKPLIE